MSIAQSHRGGAPVGQLEHVEGVEAASVRYFRLWSGGMHGRLAMRSDFAHALGAEHGGAAADAWEALMNICVDHGRRPLMHHALGCKCLGADESCFANFIATATDGEREDALLIATLLVRADMAQILTTLACECGLALKCMALAASRDIALSAPVSATLH